VVLIPCAPGQRKLWPGGLELVKKLIFASILVILNPYEEVTLRDQVVEFPGNSSITLCCNKASLIGELYQAS
jgi:hypothetical protein